MKHLFSFLFILSGLAQAQISSLTLPHIIDSATIPKVVYVDDNDAALKNRLNIVIDSVNADTLNDLLKSNTSLRLTIDADNNGTGTCVSITHNGATDTIAKFCDDLASKFFGAVTGTSLTLTGNATLAKLTASDSVLAATVNVSGLTASLPVFTNAGKTLASNAMTGTGSVVMSASPTLTGTAAFANTTTSGTALTTGVHTFTAAPVFSSATASLPMFTDASKGLVSNAMTGTGSVMMSASPTTTGTLTGAAANFSSTLSAGTTTLGAAGSTSTNLIVNGAIYDSVSSNASYLNAALRNGSTGTAAISILDVGESTTANIRTQYYGSGFTTSGYNIAASGMLTTGSAASGGMTLLIQANAPFRVYTNATERYTISGAGVHTLTGAASVTSTLTLGAGVNMENAQGINMKNSGGTYRQVLALQSDNTLDIGATVDGGIRFFAGVATAAGTVSSVGGWSLPSTLNVTGVATFTAAPVFSSVTASQTLEVDGSKSLTSVAQTGTGSYVKATSPTLVTPALGAATATSLVASGNVTADSLISEKLYKEDTFTLTLTGISGSSTVTARYTRIGKVVVLYWPDLVGTSNATGLTMTGMPVAIRPAREQWVVMDGVQNNTTEFYQGSIAIATSGVMTVYARNSLSAFPTGSYTASGTKGVLSSSVTYTMQ